METNVLVSGKLGDLFHSLYVCNHVYVREGKKVNLFITDKVEHFENGLENTLGELVTPIKFQDWCNSFQIWNGEHIDIDTTQFRKSPWLYNTCWSEIMLNTFFPNQEYVRGAWVSATNTKDDILVVNRRYKNEFTPMLAHEYKLLGEQYKKKVFLGSQTDYDLFPLNAEYDLVQPNSIIDWLFWIGLSDLFVGNQSAPLAMASAMDARRVAELLPRKHPDWIHYRDESKYSSNFVKYIQ